MIFILIVIIIFTLMGRRGAKDISKGVSDIGNGIKTAQNGRHNRAMLKEMKKLNKQLRKR